MHHFSIKNEWKCNRQVATDRTKSREQYSKFWEQLQKNEVNLHGTPGKLKAGGQRWNTARPRAE